VTSTTARLSAHARLAAAIAQSELPNYVYSYPSKRAYRPVDPAMTLTEAWAGHHGPLNIYIHIPFCGYRCSFCTLFLTTNHRNDLIDRYVDSLRRQLEMHAELLADSQVVSVYIGGGTPTTLTPEQFEAIFTSLYDSFPDIAPGSEISVEGSPDTMRKDLLSTLSELGVNRISMGVQTLDPDEAKRAGRQYPIERVGEAAELISSIGFANVNYDLIYGLEGQTRRSWLHSLRGTLAFQPDTVTLYPIVFRPLTVIERRNNRSAGGFLGNTEKYRMYDDAVGILKNLDFHQNTFVRFSRKPVDGLLQEAADFGGVPLLGLGAGSRSYSPRLHYSTDFAVRTRSTNAIIEGFADHHHEPSEKPQIGFVMNREEARRRYCILNLSLGRLNRVDYEREFESSLDEWSEEIDALVNAGCATRGEDDAVVLTESGFKYSNVIGTLFQSEAVTALERNFVPA
jgi:oxygen-independent coproporphyrinogen III oxidase